MQLSLFPMKNDRLFGGSLSIGKRKRARPLSTKESIHLVLSSKAILKAGTFKKHETQMLAIINRAASTWGVRIYRMVVNLDHIHLLIKIPTRVEDLVSQNKQRFERVQGHFQRQNEMIQSGIGDVNNKIAQVVSRVNERKVSEGMVKEMVDRQASLVQSFEVRMQQLQRVISEQEMQLMNARTELREALQELARLKRL